MFLFNKGKAIKTVFWDVISVSMLLKRIFQFSLTLKPWSNFAFESNQGALDVINETPGKNQG